MQKFYKKIAAVALVACAATTSGFAQDSPLYGSVLHKGYSYDLTQGLYVLPTTSTGDLELAINGVQALSAFIDNGKYYALNNGSGSSSTVKVYDLKTGSLIDSWSGTNSQYQCFGIDKDPVTGEYYGVFYDDDQYYVELATVTFDGATPTRTQTIGKINTGYLWLGFTIGGDGTFYGLYSDGYSSAKLYTINRETGKATAVSSSSTGVYADTYYNASACFDRTNNKLYWSVYDEDSESWLYTVSTDKGRVTKVHNYDGDARVAGLAIDRTTVVAGAPDECQNVEVNFAEGSLSGNITLTAPTTLVDGSNGEGDLTIKVLANSEEIASVAAEWGASLTIPVTLSTPDVYNFSVFAVNAEGEGKQVNIEGMFLGPDSPKAPVASLLYEDEKMIVSWDAVTESVHGGYVDWSKLTYDVIRFPGAVTVATGLTETTFTEDFPETDGKFYYQVIAVAGEYKSAPGETNAISMGAIVPPFTSVFNSETLADYTIIDSNGDGRTWKLNGSSVRVQYNASKKMDDWLITPAIKLESGKSYKFTALVHSHSSSLDERIEVKYGVEATVEGMTVDLIAPTKVLTYDGEKKEITSYIVPSASKRYYIGFHGISDEDMYYLYLDEYTIEEGVPFPVPGDLKVVIPDKADYAELTWEAPEFVAGGYVKADDLQGYNVYRDDELLNESPITETSYQDPIKQRSDLVSYYVKAVYPFGESLPSNVEKTSLTSVELIEGGASVAVADGAIIINDAEGLNVTVVSASGLTVFNGAADHRTVISATPGIYVVRLAGKTCKVIVK